MIFEREKPILPLAYDDWKIQLRQDCEVHGKLLAFEAIGEYTLQLLWEEGINPTVEAIIGNAAESD